MFDGRRTKVPAGSAQRSAHTLTHTLFFFCSRLSPWKQTGLCQHKLSECPPKTSKFQSWWSNRFIGSSVREFRIVCLYNINVCCCIRITLIFLQLPQRPMVPGGPRLHHQELPERTSPPGRRTHQRSVCVDVGGCSSLAGR